jgi:hypothetical protein
MPKAASLTAMAVKTIAIQTGTPACHLGRDGCPAAGNSCVVFVTNRSSNASPSVDGSSDAADASAGALIACNSPRPLDSGGDGSFRRSRYASAAVAYPALPGASCNAISSQWRSGWAWTPRALAASLHLSTT